MPAGKSKFAASRWTAALVLAGMLVLGFGLTAMAQSVDAESHNGLEETWHDGLEGTWRAQVTVSDCQYPNVVLRTFPAKFSYAKGGTLTGTTAGQLPSLSTAQLGVWKHLHGHTYRAVSEAFFFSPAGAWTSTQMLTRVIEVGSDENEYTDNIALKILDTNGNVIVTGCGTSVARRMK